MLTSMMTVILRMLTCSRDDLVALTEEFSYSEFLPSVNAVLEVNDNVLVRGGAFRAISRPDPSDLGSGRTISTLSLDDDTDTLTIGAQMVTHDLSHLHLGILMWLLNGIQMRILS